MWKTLWFVHMMVVCFRALSVTLIGKHYIKHFINWSYFTKKKINSNCSCLLDAPCTGLGVVSRDPSIKFVISTLFRLFSHRSEKQKKPIRFSKTLPDVTKCAHLQKQLILSAIDSVDAKSKSGGIVVYSTCSISVEVRRVCVDAWCACWCLVCLGKWSGDWLCFEKKKC